VEKTPFDHTSLLKYLMDKWHLGPLGARTDKANSVSVAFRESAPRTDTPAFIRVPYTDLMPQRPELERYDVSRHDEAITAFASFLAREEEAISADVVSALSFEAALWIGWKAAVGRFFGRIGHALAHGLNRGHDDRVSATRLVARKMIEKAQGP